MAFRPLKSFFPTVDELLQQELPALAGVLLAHLKSYQGLNTVYQHAGLNRGYFRAMLENRNVGLGPLPKEPEYGTRQPQVTDRMMEAWNWLERQGMLIHNDQQTSDWFTISRDGEKLLKRNARFEQWEKLGLDRVKSDLTNTGGTQAIGGTQEVRDLAWEWVRMKENKPPVKPSVVGEWVLIAESRLDELRALKSSQFDFRKLIRLCEELNINSREECHFATAALTRALVDHVPPLFGKNNFSEVANNYVGLGIGLGELEHFRVWREDSRDVLDPGTILGYDRRRDFELFFQWIEGDPDADCLVVLGEHLDPENRCHEGRDPLLSINENPLAGRRGTVLQPHVGVAPGDEVADGVPAIERVEQVADFFGFPDKRALDFGDGDLA